MRFTEISSLTYATTFSREEPQSTGAWRFGREQFLDGVVRDPGRRVPSYVGGAESAAPAPGSHKAHLQEPEALVRKALEEPSPAAAAEPASGPLGLLSATPRG